MWRWWPLLTWVTCLTAAPGLAQDLVPPEVEYLPDIEVPEGVELPSDGRIPVVVRIDVDGRAALEQCELQTELCEVVREAIEAAAFRPATQDGEPVAARVKVALRVAKPPPTEQPPPQPRSPAQPQEPSLQFSTTAEVDARSQEPIVLELEGIRNLPGTLGEPYRVLELLPGVVPIVNGQPYAYVRGAPPVGTIYLYDDIPVPALFHAALGPMTIHPGLIGDVKLFPAAAPARFGRFTGGVMAGEARDPFARDRPHGEIELRAIDASALLNIPVMKDGSVVVAGRYGFPNLLLDAINVDADIEYWDYQTRTELTLGRARFQLVAIGARDASVVDQADETDRFQLDLQFHRVEARLFGNVNDWELGGAVLYGYDFAFVDDASGRVTNASSQLNRVGPRLWARYEQERLSVRLGADTTALFGTPECEPDEFAEIQTPCDEDFVNQSRRVFAGVFAELSATVAPWLDVAAGARIDAWDTGGQTDVGVSPRLRLTFHPHHLLDVYAAWGFGFQPATFVIPLPGLGDVPLEPGLQRASQTEGGVRFHLPFELQLELTGFINHYRDLRFLDFYTDTLIFVEADGEPALAGILDGSADGRTYGAEVLLTRPFGFGLSTLIAYTLSFSDLDASATLFAASASDFSLTPSYDVRHVINAALSWQSKFGLLLGARVHARSGRALGWVYFDNAAQQVRQYIQRSPWFVRLDAQIAYDWSRRWGWLRFGLEWINITQARDAEELDSSDGTAPQDCIDRVGVPAEPCPVEFTGAIWFPNLIVRAQF